MNTESTLNNNFFPNATTCPLRLRGLSFPPHPLRLWLRCNRFLRLGRPVGAVTLSRWEWWWMRGESEVPGGALNLIFTNYPDHGHHGRLPLSRKDAHGRAGNRTRDLMVSSQELWPPSHEAGLWDDYHLQFSLCVSCCWDWRQVHVPFPSSPVLVSDYRCALVFHLLSLVFSCLICVV